MATELTMTGNKKLSTVISQFSKKFDYLFIRFLSEKGNKLSDDRTVAETREKKGGDLSIVGNLTVGSFENRINTNYGINVEVYYNKNGRNNKSSGDEDKMTLSKLNRWAKENGCAKQS